MVRLDEVIGLVTKPPRSSKPVLETNRDAFILVTGLFYDYYPIKLKPISLGDKFIRIEKSPPVLADGLIICNKKVYTITKQELLRRKFNVANECPVSTTKHTSTTNTVASASPGLQPGLSETLGDEVAQDVNLAWEEQVGALLYAENSQTWDWENEIIT
jgi:hypothetical protein